jgi:hypothetical protein
MSIQASEKSSVYSGVHSPLLPTMPRPITVTKEDIQGLASLKFKSTDKGLTYKDLLKPKYKRANTEKDAKRTLNYHHIRKHNLHTKGRTTPQQYFSSQQDAQLAYDKNHREKSSVYSQPMGVVNTNNDIIDTRLMALGEQETVKADNLTHRILDATGGIVPVGMHAIVIHVNLPYEYADIVYNDRLVDVVPQKTKQRAKRIEKRIDDYLVTCLIYPRSSKVIISIGCSDRQFPLSPFLDDETMLTAEFNDFVGQIRAFLASRLSDSKGIIVPPIHSSRWRFIQADLAWDTPISIQDYRIMTNIQLKTWNGVRLQLYKKRMADGNYYARVEECFHPFSNDNKSTSFNDNIGSTIKEAVRNAQEEILKTKCNHQ